MISDKEFEAAFEDLDEIYEKHLKRAAMITHVDPLGIARWTTDYYTLRVAGISHEGALKERRRRIFSAANITDPEVSVTRDPFTAS